MNNQKSSYVSFPKVYDSTNDNKLFSKSANHLNIDNAKIESIKHDLLNIYSSKKYAKWFSIDETKTHEEGNYTVYKVVYRFIPSDLSEKVKELIVWKRFNDFKELHKLLSKYHASLHRRQIFPEFVKPKFFGRFDQKIIDERKECILKLLQFCATQPHLYLHEKFIEFFSSGNILDHEIKSSSKNNDENLLKPTTVEILKSSLSLPSSASSSTLSLNNKISESQSSLPPQQQQLPASTDINIEDVYSELSNLLLMSSDQTASNQTNEHDYIKKSLQYIQDGIFNEKQGNLTSAFDLYKLAVSTLIKGIQKETQQLHIKIIREKTQQLLLKAEMLIELKTSNSATSASSATTTTTTTTTTSESTTDLINTNETDNDQNRWIIIESIPQLTYEIEPNLTNLHGTLLELNENFKIIKILENNCYLMKNKLVSDSNNYYFLKCLVKSSNPNLKLKSIVPKTTQIKYMIKLYKYYENEFTIFLLLEYKKFGEFYNYMKFKSSNSRNDQRIVQSVLQSSNTMLANDEQKLKQISSFTCNLNVNYYHQDLIGNLNVGEATPPKHLFELSNCSSKSGDDDFDISKLDTNDLVNKLNNIHLKFDVRSCLAQLVCALEALHSIGIICKDLKPKNLLLDDDQNGICLSYFSQWCLVDEHIDPYAVHHLHCAPEINSILVDDGLNESCDWWSFGVICYELLTLNKFSDFHSMNNYANIVTFPNNFDETAANFISQLVQINPKNRLTIDKIKSHQYFSSINWQQLQK